MFARSLARVAILAVLLALVGCPKPRRTLVPSVPTSGDATARQRFLDVRARFLRAGDEGREAADFRAIADEFASDPIAPFARLYAGIAAEQAGEHEAAARSLDELLIDQSLEPGLRTRAALFLGLARGALGDHARALPHLIEGEKAIENDAERGAWIVARAHAHAASADPLAALPWFDRWWAIATPPERAFIRGRLEQLVAVATPEAARAAWAGLGGDGPSVGILGWRVATELAAGGDVAGARAARSRAVPVRRAVGLAVAGEDDAGDRGPPLAPGVLGAIVSQSAKQARVGEQLAKGLLVGTSSLAEAAPAIQIEDAEGPAAADAVATLARTDALAILGPTDGASVDAAGARATELGIPLLSFNPRADERPAGGIWVFHLMHSAEARARALARKAIGLGVKKLVVLRPKSGYGAAVARAFVTEVAAAGGEVLIEVEYPADTRSFAAVIKKLGIGWQGVFVPDQADRLELIAPALASAGLIARPAGTKKAAGGRPVLLLSTAEGASDDFVREAARYSDGSLLAPGYFPGALDAAGLEFERRYLEATGKSPTAVDAYAYDAVHLCAALRAGGAATRRALADRLAAAKVDGVTGTMSFDRDHRRADPGVIYTVDSSDGTPTVKSLR